MSQRAQQQPAIGEVGWNLENTYRCLPPVFFEEVHPALVPAPSLSVVNKRLADELGLNLEGLSEEDCAALFAGQQLPPGSQPIAQAYAGHQFGGFTMLGDGRAILLGEQRDPKGRLVDVQFKGSGQTPFSRMGDGKAALGPMLREYIISEAMHALGIPTTRGLAVVTTGEPVYREKALPGAILVRVASSHLRVGTFQYAAARREPDHVRALADYSIERHYPELKDAPNKCLQLLSSVMDRQASLIARWQLVGFIHGVMNTDNMAISGETIDYGPCAFMDTYHPETVFSSIDHAGRYAYCNQPPIGQWNLARFAETLLPLINPDQAQAIEQATETLGQYPDIFGKYWLDGMRRKLGLPTENSGNDAEDQELIDGLLTWMQASQADFTNTFDDLSTPDGLTRELYRDQRFQDWHARWLRRLEAAGQSLQSAQESMQQANPAIIPRNHRVEEALRAAAEHSDVSVMHDLLEVLSSPFERNEKTLQYRTPPPPGGRYQTFCGT